MNDPRRGILYQGVTSAPQPQRSRTRKPRPCPCCNAPGGLCDVHKARLGAVRESLAGGEGHYKKRWDKTHKPKPPVCCAPDCWEPRVPPAAFCAECQARGFVEEPE